MADPNYRRLTRARSRALFGIVSTTRSSLWLGQDHLLCIDTSGYTESYKRFYYGDIQAVIIRQTQHWKIRALLLAGVAVLIGLIAVLIGDATAGWILGSLGGIFLLAFFATLAGGPSCACHLRTAVQTEELVSLNRLRVTRKALARLGPLIEAAQGRLEPEDLRGKFQELQTGSASPRI